MFLGSAAKHLALQSETLRCAQGDNLDDLGDMSKILLTSFLSNDEMDV